MTGPVAEQATGNYFVSAYPPFSTWNAEALDDYREALRRPRADGDVWGLYVHIPFCVERCHFCYYLSHDHRPEAIERTVLGIGCEAQAYAATPAFADGRPSFVYFGGGTPSLLSVPQLGKLFDGLRGHFDWTTSREVSFECAPRSLTARKAQFLRDSGVSRISLGVQQLDDDVLRANGRVHLTDDVLRAWDRVAGVGFDVVNIDLIAGLVGESDETFDASLERVIDLAPDSVTLYQLEIPANTPLFDSLKGAEPQSLPADWSVKRERLRRAFARLEATGFTVRSAYTATRTDAAASFVYQDEQYRGSDLLGLGVSAFGYVGGVHQQNRASMTPYFKAVEHGELPLGRAYRLSADERLVREFILQLKLGGVDRVAFRARHGVDPVDRFTDPLAQAECDGMLRIVPDAVELTRDGLLRVDRLLPEFYRPEHRGLRYS